MTVLYNLGVQLLDTFSKVYDFLLLTPENFTFLIPVSGTIVTLPNYADVSLAEFLLGASLITLLIVRFVKVFTNWM